MRVGSRGSSADRSARGTTDEIVVFPTGPTVAQSYRSGALDTATHGDPIADPAPPDASNAGDTADGSHDMGRGYHARPGHRPGAATTGGRAGGGGDIVRPLLVAPAVATQIVLSGAVFREPIPHLRFDGGDADPRYLVWSAAVVGEHGRPIPVSLHVLGSPSMVVTVLELVPAKRLRWGLARFVDLGVLAVDELAHRIERAA